MHRVLDVLMRLNKQSKFRRNDVSKRSRIRRHCHAFDINLQVPLGIQIATSIRIGQYMGSGSKDGAITAARLGILAVCMYTVIVIFNLIVL